MKKIIAIFIIAASISACKNGSSDTGTAGDSTPTITSGNTDARQGQVIPMDSVDHTKDSTGKIHTGDSTKM